jgi:hypothetical protein
MMMSENRVLRKIFGPKMDEVTGMARRLRDGQLYDLYSSPYIIWMMKSRTIRWAGHVTRMRHRRCAYRILVGRAGGKRPLEDLCVDGRIKLKADLQEAGWGGWIPGLG